MKITVNALVVDLFGGLQHVEIDANRSGKMNESLHVFRKTKTAKAKSGLEELATNARIKTHGVGHFIDVGANFFAEVSNHVGVTYFQREKRIGGVLYKLGTIDGSDQKRSFVFGGAFALVHGTMKTMFEDRFVDFTQLRGGNIVFHTDDDSVG